MASFKYVITDEVGIHARPAGLLVKKLKEFAGCKFTLEGNGKSCDPKKLMALMALGVKQGAEVTVTVDGDNADAVAAELEEYFKANL